MTPSQAKNSIKKALQNLVDPDIGKKDRDEIWEYFECRCAFCDTKLDQSTKKGHIDHLIPSSKRGSNRLANRVLACAACNGNDKRDLDWEPFLRRKAKSEKHFTKRQSKILTWIERNGGKTEISESSYESIDRHYRDVEQIFSKACKDLRESSRER